MKRLCLITALILTAPAHAETLIETWRECVDKQFIENWLDLFLDGRGRANDPILATENMEAAFAACATEEGAIRSATGGDPDGFIPLAKLQYKQKKIRERISAEQRYRLDEWRSCVAKQSTSLDIQARRPPDFALGDAARRQHFEEALIACRTEERAARLSWGGGAAADQRVEYYKSSWRQTFYKSTWTVTPQSPPKR